MSIKHLQDLYVEAVRLGALLRTLHAALPDDLADSETDTRFIVGWACDLVTELSNDIDLLDLSQCGAMGEAKGGANE